MLNDSGPLGDVYGFLKRRRRRWEAPLGEALPCAGVDGPSLLIGKRDQGRVARWGLTVLEKFQLWVASQLIDQVIAPLISG